jgi:metal-responsive CopG/Arc/MetJ family transcriptional regulator
MAKTDNLSEVLNIRIDTRLAEEVERLAQRRGMTASEVARELMTHGVQVERQVEAQELRRHYASLPYDRTKGRVLIDAKFEWYTNRELQEMEFGPDLDEYGDPIQ